MTEFIMSDSMILTLKGAPISIICLMILHPEPLGAQFIERHTGYNDKYTASALLLLEELGLVTRNGRYNWQLASVARQLPLIKMLGGNSEVEPELAIQVENADIVDGEIIDADETEGVGKSDSENPTPSSSSSGSLTTSPDLDLTTTTRAPDPENPRFKANFDACDNAGIYEPKRSAISRMKHVTPELIRYHTQTARSIPLAIYRISEGWKIKAGWVDVEGSTEQTVDVTQVELDEPELPGEQADRWSEILIILQRELRRADFETWIKPVRVVGCGSDGWVLRIGNSLGGEWIREHAQGIIERELGLPVKVVWE